MQNSQFNQLYAKEQLRRSHHPIRRLIKYFYLNNVLKDVKGIALDVGCGAGQLLARLPEGSLGLEINPFLVEQLLAAGMNVKYYDMNEDDCNFSSIPKNEFKTLILSHVLEHFPDAANTMRKIFKSSARLGISRIVVIVPGKLGYKTDKTHRTFINKEFIKNNNLEFFFNYKLTSFSYFPFPTEIVGNLFTYQELKLIYDLQ